MFSFSINASFISKEGFPSDKPSAKQYIPLFVPKQYVYLPSTQALSTLVIYVDPFILLGMKVSNISYVTHLLIS